MEARKPTLKTWNDIAVWYNKQRATSPSAQTEAPLVLERLGDVRGKLILDAGSAGGYYTFLFERLGARVVAIDSAPHMIEHMEREQTKAGIPKDKIRSLLCDVADCEKLGLLPESFDAVLCASLLNDIPDVHIAKSLSALNRMLKSNGIIVVTLPHPLKSSKEERNSNDHVIKDYVTHRKKLSKWKDHTKPDDPPMLVEYEHRPVSFYINELISAGFKIVNVVEPTLNTEITPRSELDRELIARSSTGIPAILVIKAVKESGI
ncbi:MAG: class I SAM-dependent methyltransferase [Candidatus Micrarchaeales archaeon]|nr:class I SAM-dependent methyltransferase [Candidatus Micrarchaeales archaeon]